MTRLVLALLMLVFPTWLSGATIVNADITTNTTWNAAGSPYQITNNGADLDVYSGATLTIDASAGNVVVEVVGKTHPDDWDLDIVIGAAGSTGALVINASGGTVTFKLKGGDNIRVTSNGSINVTDSTYATTFTRYDSSHSPGALVFEASQTQASSLKKCSFSYMGYDSKDGALYVKSSATYVPRLENLSFDNCYFSAIRMDGNGVNVLKEGNVTLPLSVTNTIYVLYLSAVTSQCDAIKHVLA